MSACVCHHPLWFHFLRNGERPETGLPRRESREGSPETEVPRHESREANPETGVPREESRERQVEAKTHFKSLLAFLQPSFTVAILAQGTTRADAITQAFRRRG